MAGKGFSSPFMSLTEVVFKCPCGFAENYPASTLAQYADGVVGFLVACPGCARPLRSHLPPRSRVLGQRGAPAGHSGAPSAAPEPVIGPVIKTGEFDPQTGPQPSSG